MVINDIWEFRKRLIKPSMIMLSIGIGFCLGIIPKIYTFLGLNLGSILGLTFVLLAVIIWAWRIYKLKMYICLVLFLISFLITCSILYFFN